MFWPDFGKYVSPYFDAGGKAIIITTQMDLFVYSSPPGMITFEPGDFVYDYLKIDSCYNEFTDVLSCNSLVDEYENLEPDNNKVGKDNKNLKLLALPIGACHGL